MVDVATDKVTELSIRVPIRSRPRWPSFSLAALTAVENLTYTGIVNFTGTGNALNNTIRGGIGNDTLNGGSGC